jgi:hypothetical protein
MKRFKPLHRFVLFTNQFASNIFIADNGLITPDKSAALIFDERDNMKDKVEYWSLITGYQLKAIELL